MLYIMPLKNYFLSFIYAGMCDSGHSLCCITVTEADFLRKKVSWDPQVSHSLSVSLPLSLSQVGQSEMRVCLNQKPNSGRDFGFKAHWDSTGACVKSVQSGKTYNS